jgi:hypothetical protein
MAAAAAVVATVAAAVHIAGDARAARGGLLSTFSRVSCVRCPTFGRFVPDSRKLRSFLSSRRRASMWACAREDTCLSNTAFAAASQPRGQRHAEEQIAMLGGLR